MKYNSNLESIYNNTKDISSVMFTSTASDAREVFNTLSRNLSEIIDSLQLPETWHDSISIEVGTNLKSAIQSIIIVCSEPVEGVINPTGSKVSSLNETIKMHMDKVDLYNDELEAKSQTEKTRPNSNNPEYTEIIEGKPHLKSEYYTAMAKYQGRIKVHDEKLKSFESQAGEWEKKGCDLADEIKALLVPVGSAPGSGVTSGIGQQRENINEVLSDGTTKSGHKILDENGNLQEEIYTIVDANGKTIKEYTCTTEADGTKTETIILHDYFKNEITEVINSYNENNVIAEKIINTKNDKIIVKSSKNSYDPSKKETILEESQYDENGHILKLNQYLIKEDGTSTGQVVSYSASGGIISSVENGGLDGKTYSTKAAAIEALSEPDSILWKDDATGKTESITEKVESMIKDGSLKIVEAETPLITSKTNAHDLYLT